MLEIKVTIACPDLPLAASALAAAINHGPAAPKPAPAAVRPMPPTNPAPAQMQMPAAGYAAPTAPAAPPTAPARPTQAPAASVPACGPVPAAPTAPAPTYTMDQIMKAGAELTRTGRRPDLTTMLQQSFGVQAVTQVPQERLGELANALRGLGARL